jgi:eukaryotic-like serine/threonine-protein kinase
MLSPDTIFNDRYQLIRKLGEGGLAEVYLAQDLALGRLVALKALRAEYTVDPSFLVRFHHEAQNAAGLTHANIVAVYDFGQDHRRPYIVMEYVSGRDLRQHLVEKGPLSIAQSVAYAIRICAAVMVAHRAGLVHGDLKPGNILISTENRVKVTDFGLARALGDSAMDEGEVVWGTPAYFAPEQAAGDRVLPATDVYATGVILYEMLSGRVPFTGSDDQEVARKQLYEAPVPVNQHNPQIPDSLVKIVDRALAKEPARRYLTAAQLRQALETFRSHSPPVPAFRASESPPSPGPAPVDTALEVDWLAMGLGLFAILAVLGLVPLGVAVYQAYARPVPVYAPTPLPSPSPGQVRVPDVVGFGEEAARSILEGAGLTMGVGGHTYHPTIPAFAVVGQSVRAGEPVALQTEISVMLSQGPELLELPDVVGQSFTNAEASLRERGLLVQRFDDWSVQPRGTVLSQDPPPASLVSSRSMVLLTVSLGTRIPVGAQFDDGIRLEAFELPRDVLSPGEALSVTFMWGAASSPRQDYTVFIHLTNRQGGIIAQYDSAPVSGSRPTSGWQATEEILDSYQLLIPTNIPPGAYQLRLGLYTPETGNRLQILQSARLNQEFEALILRDIRVD